MSENEDDRISRLLASVEKEEMQLVERPTGAFTRHLFSDSETDGEPDDEPDEPEIDADEVIIANVLENNLGDEDDDRTYDDFSDLENLPLNDRLKSSIVRRQNNKMAFVSKDRKVLWDVDAPPVNVRSRQRNIILMRMGHVNNPAKNAKSPSEIWSLFFTEEMIEEITDCTNVWIDKNKRQYTRERDCHNTNPQEIKCVIGLLYMAGTYKAARLNLEDLWGSDGGGIEFFRLAMSLKRFKLLLRALRFDDIRTREQRKTTDKLAPVRSIINQFVNHCQENYVVSEFVTIDEMLASFRGRCSFRQYIKNKPAKYGVKIFAMVCAKSFYTTNLEVYAGMQPDGPFKVENSGKSVVERMVQPISGSRRNVTVDNWFCSISLCKDLLKNHMLTLVGTIRKNKKEIPPVFVDKKRREPGDVTFGFQNDCTLVSYAAKKNKVVALLSSMHSDAAVDNDEGSATFGKPEIILFYNSSKGGVDTVDKYVSHYSVARTTNRWSMVIAYALFNVGGLNSFIIFKKNNNNPTMKRRIFLIRLAKELCKDHMVTRVSIPSTPTNTKKRLRQILEITEERRAAPADDVTSGRCHACDWRKNRLSKTKCAACSQFICREHSAPAKCAHCVQSAEEEMDVDSE
uniref:PiggyBac transposable element-derived protein domain-containing protein n=1 Tax=Graphocephala atropunctata TaxID=36148 RepID=A0A1B6MTB6_9HEMI